MRYRLTESSLATVSCGTGRSETGRVNRSAPLAQGSTCPLRVRMNVMQRLPFSPRRPLSGLCRKCIVSFCVQQVILAGALRLHVTRWYGLENKVSISNSFILTQLFQKCQRGIPVNRFRLTLIRLWLMRFRLTELVFARTSVAELGVLLISTNCVFFFSYYHLF